MSDVTGKPTLESRVQRLEHVLHRDLRGEVVLLDTVTGTYLGLDETGSRIWLLLGEVSSLAGVLEKLLDEYDVDRATCERDLIDLVEDLADHGLVTVDP